MIQQYPTLEETEQHIQHRARFWRAMWRFDAANNAMDAVSAAGRLRPHTTAQTAEDARIIRGFIVRQLCEIPEEATIGVWLSNLAADFVEW